jgi:uncharacterized damage-inducible protein DinB
MKTESFSAAFVHDSVELLRDTYLPRMQRALDALPAADLWLRPHDGALAFGTILLHLEGNVRQWICSGIGGAPDHRNRASEFAAQGGPAGQALVTRLAATVTEACAVIADLDEAALQREYPIQGNRVTGRWAVYHVVEHFSWHTGQAVWIAKARAGRGHGVAFYDDARANAAKNG